MGLVPLVWLACLRLTGIKRDAAWWWVAAALSISWIADWTIHIGVSPWLASAVYPVTQAALIGAVFLPRRDAQSFVAVLVLVGLMAVLWNGTDGPDRFLHTVAWLSVVGIVGHRPSPLRPVVPIAFACLWLAWLGYALAPGWPSWLLFQGVRLGGLVAFCWIAWKPPLALRIA